MMEKTKHDVLPIPAALLRHYVPGHEVTVNYIQGLKALEDNQPEVALRMLEAEPEDSPCRGLALGNCGLALIRMEDYGKAEQRLDQTHSFFETHACPHPASWVQFSRHRAEAISRQGRHVESLRAFNQTVHLGKKLINQQNISKDDIDLEIAHTFNSWGGALIQLQDPAAAADCLQEARNIYRVNSSTTKVGHVETLTNYALALTQTNRRNEASIALQEASSIAKTGGNKEQLRRIQIATIQLDPTLLDLDAYAVLDEAVEEAILASQLSTAYVRLCIKASLAEERNEHRMVIDTIEKAYALESHLDPSDPSPAQSRLTLAKALDGGGDPIGNVLKPMFQGARLYFDRLSRARISEDFQVIARSMHDHFRYFSRKLFDAGRLAEALTAFEFGRALGYTVTIDESRKDKLLALNPFCSEYDNVDCSFLASQQNLLLEDEVLICPIFLPPQLVAFVVGRESIGVVSEALPEGNEFVQRELDDLQMIGIRLQEQVGLRAIPSLIQKFASKIATEVGGKKIHRIFPNSLLHSVPWRALLHNYGIPWKNLVLATGFGLVTRDVRNPTVINGCCALGHGMADVIDLNKEAQEFADAFGVQGRFVSNCSARDVISALNEQPCVLISCHGDLYRDPDTGSTILRFQLQGGGASIDQVLPESVSSLLVILSACNSGAYEIAWGDYPAGAAPEILRRGGRYCIAARYRVGAKFAADMMRDLAQRLAAGTEVSIAFAQSLEQMEHQKADPWKDLACFELLGID